MGQFTRRFFLKKKGGVGALVGGEGKDDILCVSFELPTTAVRILALSDERFHTRVFSGQVMISWRFVFVSL